MRNKILKIISGGQTGADRAALDFALENGITTGGFVPKGRMAEDGRLPDKYPYLTETVSSDPAERTELNVVNSDATLLLSHGELSGGSKLTEKFALEHNRPVLHIDLLKHKSEQAVEIALEWLKMTDCRSINIAGPRRSEDAAIYDDVMTFLKRLFLKS